MAAYIVRMVLDAVLSVPSILALLVAVNALGNGPTVILLTIAVVYVPQVVQLVRGARAGCPTR
jgi:peptide/nickel transport system permease protein